MMGELEFFLGIQIDQKPEATYIHQSKYTKSLLKKFNMIDYTVAKTPMHPTCIMEKEEVSGKVCQKLIMV